MQSWMVSECHNEARLRAAAFCFLRQGDKPLMMYRLAHDSVEAA